MGYLFKFALKNILRAKTRTILTFLILSFGVAMYIWMVCLLDGFDKASLDNLLAFDMGHLKIRSVEYDEDKPYSVSNFLENYAEAELVLDEKDYITGYTERSYFVAELDNYIVSSPVIVVGIDPETDGKVFNLTNFTGGDYLENGTCILGKKLAEDMGVYVGDFVYLTMKTKQGMAVSYGAEVSAIANTVDPVVNNSTVYITMDEAKELLNVDSVTEIIVLTDDYEKKEKYQKDLVADLPEFSVKNWEELSADYFKVSETKRAGLGMIGFFIVIIALVGIINTMLMSVYEKQKEIGTLKAMGMKDRDVRRLFMIEGSFIGVAGAILGIIVAIPLVWYFTAVGWDISALMGEDMDIGWKIMGVVKSAWSISAFIKALLLCIIASTIASYVPARKTTKMEPMECLRVNQ